MPINEKGEFIRARSRTVAATRSVGRSVSTISQPQSRGLSIASLVLGLTSLLCTGILTAPVAIGLGIAALKKINREPARYMGAGLAWSGVATGTVALLISAAWIIPYLSKVISQSQPAIPSRSTPTTSPSTTAEEGGAGVFGWLRKSAATQGAFSNQFEVRILSGSVSSDRIVIQVRETSKDYDGYWADWGDVLRQTYVSDNLGNTYQCDWGQSSGSTNGPVRAGDSREGTLVFPGAIRRNISRLTLGFAYFPGNSPILVQSAVVRDPSQTEEQASNDRRPLEDDMIVNVTDSENSEFEIRMMRGFVYPDRVALRIRETSINCECYWVPWRDVVAASFIIDENGNRYAADLSHSVGWTDGSVSPGGYREGTIVFWGNIPQNTSQITLTFAWIPNSPISMNIPLRNTP